MVQVRSIAEMGAYVSLLEYGNIEGMILLSELSRRRIRSVQKLIKVRAAGAGMAGVPLGRGLSGASLGERGQLPQQPLLSACWSFLRRNA